MKTQQSDFSTSEHANQISGQLQLAVFERFGIASQNGLYALILLILCFIAWAAIAESDVCAEASGRLEPRIRVLLIQPTSDGTIAEYLVKDGQSVKKGELLIRLNTVRAEAELRKKQEELSILKNELNAHENARQGLARIILDPSYHEKESLILPEVDRIAGELYASKKSLDSANYDMSTAAGKGLRMSPEMAVLSAQQKKLESVRDARKLSVRQNAEERVAERKKLESKIAMLEAGLDKSRVELAELEAGLDDAKKEMEIYEKGKELGVASEVKFLEIKNYMYQKEYYVQQQRLQIAEREQELSAARLDLDSSGRAFDADQADLVAGVKAEDAKISSVPISMNETARTLEFKQAAFEVAAYHARARYAKEMTEISNLQRKISECNSAVRELEEELREKYLRAPFNGEVSDLVHLLPGEMVLRGQTLMSLVPSASELVLRAEVNNADVGFVELGQTARLRVSAFPCEEFGIIQGKVVRVDDYPEEKIENKKKVSVYKVTIEPEKLFLKNGEKQFQLMPGLDVHADIVLRKRTLLELLFEPLLKMGKF